MKTRLSLKVAACARQTAFAGRFDDAWKLHVAVRITSGLTASRKTVEIEGVSAETLERAILESHGPRPHTGSAPPRET